jgi:alpha-amylase/alpha-mannosidase (GH57 family)
MNKCICIHGHFYQPPRENPWLEELELQDSAYPYHDWNDRITAECYGPNTAARILDAENRVIDIVNNYSRISFNVGPTLLSWMERKAPRVYHAILEADRLSQERFSGHGSGMAQVYNHLIMPLANTRDKRTQVLWGIRDFEHRFSRSPEGMWLAETAVDLETLDMLAEYGVAFTVLAPSQASRIRKLGDKNWQDVKGEMIDPRRGYRVNLPSGNSLALYFYDGPVSRDIAFGGLLGDGDRFAARLVSLFSEGKGSQLAHVATDGESYGHHHRFGDMALAFALNHIETNNLATLTNYGEYLEKYPPTYEVEIIENSSWSCAHGVERWRANCGCSSGMHAGWTQEWRAPLREAMDWLRDQVAPLYEREMAAYVQDPWLVRNDYFDLILDRTPSRAGAFLAAHAGHDLAPEGQVRCLKFLEMQRHAMLMFTSCGWFFDDIAGIETVQILQYASRAIQLARELTGVDLEPAYRDILSRASCNTEEFKTGADVWKALVQPATVDLLRVAAHYAISSLFEDYPETTDIFCYTATADQHQLRESGLQRLVVGKARITSHITQEEQNIGFAALHLGDHNMLGGARPFAGSEACTKMEREIGEAFDRSDVPDVIRLMDKHFETHNYSLWHLFKDEQRAVLDRVVNEVLTKTETAFRDIYDRHYPLMQVLRDLRSPLPKALAATTEFILNADIKRILEDREPDLAELQRTVEEVRKWPSLALDTSALGFAVSRTITRLMEALDTTPEDISPMTALQSLLTTLHPLALELNLWEAQNIYLTLRRGVYPVMSARARRGDQPANQWIALFDALAEPLHVRGGL